MSNDPITIATFLPSFNGFYGTIWESLIDNDEYQTIENDCEESGKSYTYDDYEVDYISMKKDLSLLITNAVAGLLKDYNLITSIEFECIVSPRFYNFTNDSINCFIDITADNVTSIKTYIEQNSSSWSKYISDKFTSHSGFISHHSNDSTSIDWDIDYIVENAPNKIGWVLDFIMENEEIGEMYYHDTFEFYAGEYMTKRDEVA